MQEITYPDGPLGAKFPTETQKAGPTQINFFYKQLTYSVHLDENTHEKLKKITYLYHSDQSPHTTLKLAYPKYSDQNPT